MKIDINKFDQALAKVTSTPRANSKWWKEHKHWFSASGDKTCFACKEKFDLPIIPK